MPPENSSDDAKTVEAKDVTGDDVSSFKAFEQSADVQAMVNGPTDAPAGAKLPGETPPAAAAPAATPPADDKSADGDKPKDAATSSADAPKKGVPARERINQLVRKSSDAERRAEAAEARAKELEAQLASGDKKVTPEAKPEVTTATDDPEPDPDAKNADGTDKYKFGELDKNYTKDLTAWTTRSTLREDRQRQEAERAQQTAQETAEAADNETADFLEAGAAKHPDFVQKVYEGSDKYDMSAETWGLLRDSPARVDIAYLFATNPAEAKTFHKLSPGGKARELVKLEARFSGTPAPAPNPNVRTPAADPPPQGARGANGQFVTNDATEDFSAFERKYQPILDAGGNR